MLRVQSLDRAAAPDTVKAVDLTPPTRTKKALRKKPGAPKEYGRPEELLTRNSRDAGCLESLVRGFDLELHLFALSKRLEPLHCDRGEVYEYVLTVGLFNEAITLGVVEP